MSKLKIALQKSGRLSEKSLELLKKCGIAVPNGSRKLRTKASNFPLEVLFLRDDDIPEYVEQGVADIGIIGENEALEQNKDVKIILSLGFARCRLCLAIPREKTYGDLTYFQNKKVATSYPNILQQYFSKHRINVTIERISGSVEIAPGIGLAEGIFDIVSTGSTLISNGLKEVQTVLESQAILIGNNNLTVEKQEFLDQFIFKIQSVQQAQANKYILLNAPNDKIKEISSLLPGMKSPTVMPLETAGWSSLHSVVKEDDFWGIIEQLKALGAEGILVTPIEKMIQ